MKFTITAICFILSLNVSFVRAQDAEKIRLLTSESMVNNSDGIQMQLAWYLADEFWDYVINVSPDMAGTSEAEEFYDIITEYTIIAVVVGSQNNGEFDFVSEDVLRKSMSLTGQDGKTYKPLQIGKVGDELAFILDIFRPIFSQMLGQLGSNFHFFVFEKENNKNVRVFDPVADEDVTLKTNGTSFTWDLPMSSLVPEKRCPDDGERMNGTWNYCPIHGTELEVVKD